jgi:hypothetical protein
LCAGSPASLASRSVDVVEREAGALRDVDDSEAGERVVAVAALSADSVWLG